MKFFKGLITTIVVLIAIVLVVSAFLPSNYEVKRTTVIEADQATVYYDVLDMRNWASWDPWAKQDSNIINVYDGMPGVGYSNTWQSGVIGNGKQTITVAKPSTYIESELYFEEMNSGGTGYFEFNEVDNGTEVVWGFKGENPFYLRIMGLLMDGMLGSQFEEGLTGMKERIESISGLPNVGEERLDVVYYISMRVKCSIEEIGPKLGEMYGGISMYMAENMVEAVGMPMAFYHEFDYESTDLEAAIQVSEGEYDLPEGMMYGSLDSGKVVSALFVGPYEGVGSTHNAISDYIEANGLKMRGPVTEIYTNDPGMVDPNEIETKVIYPVQ